MRTQIKIKKVELQDLELFKNALNHYSGTLQFLLETLEKERFAKDFSITVELWYVLNKKTAAQYPAKSNNLKLSLHYAYVLLDALKNYGSNGITDYEKSRCNRYYIAIDEQLPTFTQLLAR